MLILMICAAFRHPYAEPVLHKILMTTYMYMYVYAQFYGTSNWISDQDLLYHYTGENIVIPKILNSGIIYSNFIYLR